MKRTVACVAGLGVALAAGGMAARNSMVADEVRADRAAAAQEAFDALKALEGTWMQADEMGAATDEIASIYHVTAGGSALIETMFPGAEHEMVTVYFVDENDALCMTHYCMLGNRPGLVAEAPTPHEMVFVCSAEGCCGDEAHMHAATIKIVDATHVSTTWGDNNAADDHEAITFNLLKREE